MITLEYSWIIFILKQFYCEDRTIVFFSKVIFFTFIEKYFWIIFILEQFYFEDGTVVLLSKINCSTFIKNCSEEKIIKI